MKKTVYVRDLETWQRATNKAAFMDKSLSEVIGDLLKKWLNDPGSSAEEKIEKIKGIMKDWKRQ